MPTFAQLNSKSGLVEIIDMESGLVVAVQKDFLPLLQENRDILVERVLPDGTVVRMQAGIDPGALVHSRSYPFSQTTVDLICQKLAEGDALTSICKEKGFPPYAILCSWRKQHPHIEAQLESARADRAEYFRDQAVQTAHQAHSSKDPINADALRVDTYKWAAGVDNTKYSAKAKAELTLNTPLQIIVSTGIDRSQKDVTNSNMEISDGKSKINNSASGENDHNSGNPRSIVSDQPASAASNDSISPK